MRYLLQRALRSTFGVAMLLSATAAPPITLVAAPQVVLDRILARVNGRIITESDVRAARVLKLVDDTTSDDEHPDAHSRIAC